MTEYRIISYNQNGLNLDLFVVFTSDGREIGEKTYTLEPNKTIQDLDPLIKQDAVLMQKTQTNKQAVDILVDKPQPIVDKLPPANPDL